MKTPLGGHRKGNYAAIVKINMPMPAGAKAGVDPVMWPL